MLRVKLQCEGIPTQKIANVLAKFGKSFPFSYRIKNEGNTIIAEFTLNSISSLNELTRRLKHIKGIEFRYVQVQKEEKADEQQH